ncbi:MAG: cupin domain-containing protein [Dehalococcoidia bacterium]|nr:cupin domain-containing protein [Dehalococcoidia bacterium]
MGRIFFTHIDDAPLIKGAKTMSGQPRLRASQFIGDDDISPWVRVQSLEANFDSPLHSHSNDELLCIIDGAITIGGVTHGPGTVAFVEKGTQHGFRTGPNGVRFLNIQQGKYTVTLAGS